MTPVRRSSSSTPGGMDEALRYNQQQLFCKQLQSLQQQLCDATQQSDELLASLYAMGKYMSTPASCLQQLAAAYPEFAAKIQRSVKAHPLRELHVEQMEGEAVKAVTSGAELLSQQLQPMYEELRDTGRFIVRSSNLLADINQMLIPVTMATAPEVIECFMTLFVNTTRIVLLMERVPWRLLVQVYTIVTSTLDGSQPQGRTAVCDLLERLQEPVQYLQDIFQPISSRISQVLELAVSAVLDHVAAAQVLESAPVFDVTRLSQTQLGITGLSLPRTYCFLQRLDDYRSWALLGFLACPAALQGVKAQALLASLLKESFLLPVFEDVMLPLHSVYQQHVTPALEQLVVVLLESGGNKSDKEKQVAEARSLVGRCHQAAAEGAEAEHAARRRHICRVLQDMLAFLEDDASQLPEALAMVLAAQAYARSELLWYFRHVGEKLPVPSASKGSAAGKLGLGLLDKPAHLELATDGHVVKLIAAVTSMYDLLEEHQDVLQAQQLATMTALLEQQVLPETATVLAMADKGGSQDMCGSHKERVVPKMLVPLVKAVVYPLAEICGADAGGVLAAAAAAAQAASHQSSDAAASADPADTSTAGSPAAVLCGAQQKMIHLTMLLSSRNLAMRPAVLEAPAQDPQYLEAIHKLLELCPFAFHFMSALERSCCLAQLVHSQHKLAALQQHVMQGSSLAAREELSACPSLIKVLHWFEHNLAVADADGEVGRDYAAEAKSLACYLLEEQCGNVALLLADMTHELRAGLLVTHAADSCKPVKGSTGAVPLNSSIADTAAARDTVDLAAAVAVAGGSASASVRSRAVVLAHALDSIGPVRVSSDRLVVPVEFLRAALQQCLLLQINDLVAMSEVPPVPSQLVRSLTDLLRANAEIQEVLSIDVRPELWQVLLNHAQPEWVIPPVAPGSSGTSINAAGQAQPATGHRDWMPQASAASAAQALGSAGASREHREPGRDNETGDVVGPPPSATAAADDDEPARQAEGGAGAAGIPMQLDSIIQAYGEWFLQHVVRDVKGQGVLFAPQLRRFTSVTGQVQVLQARASLPELAALLKVFGPYAAVRLSEMTEGLVVHCLSQLDSCLSRWKELLDPVTMAVMRDDSCSDAVSAALSALSDEAQVLTQARQLSRCLAFRQLLSEAMETALAATFPAAAATVDAVASNLMLPDAAGAACDADDSDGVGGSLVAGRHLCDMFDLPRPGMQGVGSPVVADPAVVNTLVGSNNYERYKAWFNLPVLLGLCLNSPTIVSTTSNLAEHSMASELHALVHAAKCLVLAQQAAANKVLTCGSRFLHPEGVDQAADMLACFGKVAATTLYLRNDAVAVRTCKQLLLEGLACQHLPPTKLSELWLPASRIRSGLCQAVL